MVARNSLSLGKRGYTDYYDFNAHTYFKFVAFLFALSLIARSPSSLLETRLFSSKIMSSS